MTLIEFSWTSLHLNNTIGLHLSLSKIESFDYLFVILSSLGFKKEVLNTIQERENLVHTDTVLTYQYVVEVVLLSLPSSLYYLPQKQLLGVFYVQKTQKSI